ncbi:MAG TPA: GNAT family N-acetyltransferase [Pyrinomonadaceae bacterium]|jgi:hypothetical protein
MTEAQFPFIDRALARRLERAEAHGSARFVETRARLAPASRACWTEVAGAYAMYDGQESPLTQTFGLGVFDPVTPAHMDALEAFFKERGAPVYHEVSPLADDALWPLLNERGYQPLEFTSVMFRPISFGSAYTPRADGRLQVRLTGEDERELWAQTATAGWSEFTEFSDFMLDLSRVSAASGQTFLATFDEQPIATGALSLHEGVALLAGASTIPAGRRQGAQLALLDARLRHAAEHGCDLAMMCTRPGSASQRNAERHGFRIAYTRIKWQLAPARD